MRRWQLRRLSAEGNALVDRGDFKRAGLAARRILQIDSERPEGMRILARIAERFGSRTAIELRQRVVSLGKPSTDDCYALARTAITFGDLKIAQGALEKIPAGAKKTAEYHAQVADLALARRDGVGVERELSEAVRLDPTNKEFSFRLTLLRFGASDTAVRDKAREDLKALQSDKNFRREATRQLVREALQQKDFPNALALARQLNGFPEKDFSDRLALLTVFHEAQDSAFQNSLAEVESTAASNPQNMAALMIWLNTHAMSEEAVTWSKKLPAESLGQHPVPVALADAYISTRDWSNLERLTRNSSWGEMDFLRMALRARAFREMGDMAKFTAEWNEAVKKVTPNGEKVEKLWKTADKWGWRGEAIALLWLGAKDSTRGEAALRTLYDYFVQSGDTQNLYRVLLHLQEMRPNDRDILNNVAQVSLLLGLNTERGHTIARDIYEKEPKNPTYVSTYAFALYLRDEAPKALKLFAALSAAQLREPTIALYYGIILAATGDGDRAAEFLDLGQKARLLPEEKALLEKARRSLAQR